MITAFKPTNKDDYKELFTRASDILSGYERTQTFDAEQTYFYKDENTKGFEKYVFTATTEDGKLLEFAEALTKY